MTLLLSNDDAAALLDMNACIEALDAAYSDVAKGLAVAGTRGEILTKTDDPDAAYQLKSMSATVASLEMGSVRINSDILTWPDIGGSRRRVKSPRAPGKRWTGLVLLFSTITGEPLAIFPDGVLQRMRVAAASGLGVKYMARQDARTVALLGSGWQAGSQVLAVTAVRDIDRIHCFSPNADRRRKFCDDMSRQTDTEIISAETTAEAVDGADIVLCATNSLDSVFDPDWIAPGMHIGCIRDGELPPAVIRACDRVAMHDPKSISTKHYDVTHGLHVPDMDKQASASNDLDFLATVPTAFDFAAGKAVGRESPDETTCFLNLRGLAVQFTAVGSVLYHAACAAGAGRDLPTDWFTEDVHP
jgi:ornithine cyclodeaminase/alanine dehydrogenase-like protein (mu-crystallin family)